MDEWQSISLPYYNLTFFFWTTAMMVSFGATAAALMALTTSTYHGGRVVEAFVPRSFGSYGATKSSSTINMVSTVFCSRTPIHL